MVTYLEKNLKGQEKISKLYLSNRLELLFHFLKAELFSSSVSPFSQRIVVVPSPAVKNWLTVQMAKDSELNVAMGIEITYLPLLIDQLMKECGVKDCKPSFCTLAFKIELELLALLESASTTQTVLKPLVTYLSGRKETRLTPLAVRLAHLFLKYGHYAGEVLGKWEDQPAENWQAALWKRLFGKGKWSYDFLQLKSCSFSQVFNNRQLHLFGLGFLSPLYEWFLQQVAAVTPTFHYLLSPTSAFWSDLVTDKERFSLGRYWKRKGASEQERESLDSYLSEGHPLLANFGCVGRERIKQLEAFDVEQYELYATETGEAEPMENLLLQEAPTTLLRALQADLLFLRSPSTDKRELNCTDHTLQLQIAPTRLREVELIYETVVHLFSTTEIAPEDVVIMAPNIGEYLPFIEAVFGEGEEEIPYQTVEGVCADQEPLVQGYLHLLSLAFGRFEASLVFQLFESTAFREKQHFNEEELQQIRRWIRTYGVRWGFDASHRQEVIAAYHQNQKLIDESGVGSFEEGVLHFFSAEEGETKETMGNFCLLLRRLFDDLRPFTDGSQLSLSDWADYLELMLTTYFSVNDEGRQLFGFFRSLREAAVVTGESGFAFASLYHHLKKACQTRTAGSSAVNLNAVSISSLIAGRATPAKVIALLGMGEADFPKREEENSLNLLLNHSYPSETDLDRYLFLEILLSAREYLYFSYTAEKEEALPSLLLTELFSTLDQRVTIGGKSVSESCIKRHPLHFFDQRYFTPHSGLKSSSSHAFCIAKSLAEKKRQKKTGFPPVYNKPLKEVPQVISLEQLSVFARNPLKPFLQQQLKLSLPQRGKRLFLNDEDFLFSSLDQAVIKRAALQKELEGLFEERRAVGRVPIGPFKELAFAEIREEVATWQEQIQGTSLKQIELSQAAVDKKEGVLYLPPLEIEALKLQIVGTLPLVSSKGWVLPMKDGDRELLKIWPLYLVLCCVIDRHQLPFEKALILVKSGKTKPPLKEPPEPILAEYLRYYFQSCQTPSLLLPEWTMELLAKDPNLFQKRVSALFTDPFHAFYNEEAKWLMGQEPILERDEAWIELAERLYTPFYRHWYPKLCPKLSLSEEIV